MLLRSSYLPLPSHHASRAVYSVGRSGNVVTLVDHDRGRTVTNDADAIVWDLSRSGTLRPMDRLIYRDTDGRWDEIEHKDGIFVGFAPIGRTSLDRALERLRT